MRSLYSSQSCTRSVKRAPTSSYCGRPAANESSSTHWRNGSDTTGQPSSSPSSSWSHARSSSVVCGEHVVDDASDDSRTGAVAVALDQRVEVILRLEHAGDATVGVEEPDAANPPVATRFGELVGVQRHVRAMKAADADVQDARA